MDDRPQTNLQLLNQLRSAGYSPEDVAQIKVAYDFVAHQFAPWFRASGKPFIAHLVGTAGVLGACRARTPVVAAGLAHALYGLGELPGGVPGMTPGMRAKVRWVLGIEAEDLVARYANFEWTAAGLATLRDRLPALAPADRDVVLIRLANELDDHLDLAALYSGNAEARRRRIGAGLGVAVDIARDLGALELASSLDRAFRVTLTTDLPNVLRTAHAASYSLMPPSAMRRQWVKIRRGVTALTRRCLRGLLPSA